MAEHVEEHVEGAAVVWDADIEACADVAPAHPGTAAPEVAEGSGADLGYKETVQQMVRNEAGRYCCTLALAEAGGVVLGAPKMVTESGEHAQEPGADWAAEVGYVASAAAVLAGTTGWSKARRCKAGLEVEIVEAVVRTAGLEVVAATQMREAVARCLPVVGRLQPMASSAEK